MPCGWLPFACLQVKVSGVSKAANPRKCAPSYCPTVNTVIRLANVSKKFGSVVALDGLDLAVAGGEVHGFLGPNGSGKTTTLRCILGLMKVDHGLIEVFGQDPRRNAVELHKRIAYVPGDVSLWPNLSGGEVIDLLARLRGGLNQRKRDILVEQFELDPTKKIRNYSKGNRQKVALIAALAADVELLLLDEPTSGLDPLMESTFRSMIDDWRAEGGAVLLSSHILAEAEALSDRISIIRAGQIVETGTLEQMRHLTRTQVTAVCRTEPTGIGDVAGVHDCVLSGNQITCGVDQPALDDFVSALSRFGIVSLATQPATLEQLFLSHYRTPGQ